MMKDLNTNIPQLKIKMYSQIQFGEAPMKPVIQLVSVRTQRELVCSLSHQTSGPGDERCNFSVLFISSTCFYHQIFPPAL